MDYLQFLLLLKLNVRSQPKVCDGCHDLKQKAINFNDVAIVSKSNDYRIHFFVYK